MESTNRRFDSFLASQKKLEAKHHTDSRQQENVKLRTELSKQEQTRLKGKRTESKVEVPIDLRVGLRTYFIALMLEEKLFIMRDQSFPQSEVNQDILSKIKEVLKKEHGGENSPWTDLQMEGLLTVKEKCQRIKKGKNEEHKQRCKTSRRLTSKLDRRCGAFELIRESLS
ncbi:unnamed protein product [Porites lobata]|uniref:Uncharacterized protein n=1 Tax=Porites lobata TaxID=104759 RepID=A0ABN8NSC3_9CNID|nr:unnamed protein product [Porites lobata]